MVATDPQIIPRSQWGANPLVTPANSISVPTRELWLHHTAGEQFGAAGMRMLQSFALHRQDAHYIDLEYTFVVDHQSCQVFESRGPGKDTAATGGHNLISHAICVMGNFQTDPVGEGLIHTLANLVAWGYEQGWWPLAFTGGHRDASGNSTACPGDHLEAVIPHINSLAAQIHAGTAPGKVAPMYDPPLTIVASIGAPTGGAWLASPDGGVYAVGGAPKVTFPKGQPYFAGRKAAQLRMPDASERRAGYLVVVVAESGESYGCSPR
jgi:hypothetical protein